MGLGPPGKWLQWRHACCGVVVQEKVSQVLPEPQPTKPLSRVELPPPCIFYRKPPSIMQFQTFPNISRERPTMLMRHTLLYYIYRTTLSSRRQPNVNPILVDIEPEPFHTPSILFDCSNALFLGITTAREKHTFVASSFFLFAHTTWLWSC